MSVERREVVVVGGGPAGAAVACFLRQRGHDVLLLDEAVFPRDKLCGEAVSPGAWRLIDAMGASARVGALAPPPLRGMRLVSPDGTAFRGEYGGGRAGLAVRRVTLDAALLAAARDAGAEVREGTRVRDLARDTDGVAGVELDGAGEDRVVQARAVVGADGRRSVVARRLSLLREHPSMRRFAVRGHWEGTEGLEELGEMHVGGGGYCGVAPLSPTLANVTFVLDRREMAPAASDLEGFYRRTLRARWPRLAERLGRARLVGPPRAIGPLALLCRASAAPGVVLVGDSAGFYDPFTGEGITLALRTAELAAEALHEALRGGHPRIPRLAAYERARHTATSHKFRFNRALQVAVSSPRAANSIARRLARRPDLADRLVAIAGDCVPAGSAFSPGFLWDVLTG